MVADRPLQRLLRLVTAISLVASIALAKADVEECASEDSRHASEDSRHGVFFPAETFPGTPGQFANRRLSSTQLKERVARWRTPYDASAGPLTAEQHAQFFDSGYLVLPSILPTDVVNSAVSSVEELVDGLAQQLHDAGAISSLHADATFHTRLTRIEREHPHANVLLHKNGVLPEGIQRVWSHHLLMGIAQQLLGSDVDIAGHPVWNLRCKTPEDLSGGQATVPWHQDNACACPTTLVTRLWSARPLWSVEDGALKTPDTPGGARVLCVCVLYACCVCMQIWARSRGMSCS